MLNYLPVISKASDKLAGMLFEGNTQFYVHGSLHLIKDSHGT